METYAKKYQILHSFFPSGGGELILPNIETGTVPYHNFLLLLEGHNFPILCSYLLPAKNIGIEHCWETHISELDKKYRNLGYGKLMYRNMFDFGSINNFTITSSVHTSNSAKRVWISLEKDGIVRFDKSLNRYIVNFK